MTRLYLYDDERARTFEPFALTRPVCELRAGTDLIRERWEHVTRSRAYGFIGATHLRDFEELDAAQAVTDSTVPPGSLIANSRFIVSLGSRLDDAATAFECDGIVCALRVRKSMDITSLLDGKIALESLGADSASAAPIAGRWLGEVWDLMRDLQTQLNEDIPLLGSELSGAAIENATIIGRNPVYCETGAQIEPFVVLDATDGPILIRRGATIASFSRIFGPCYIGAGSQVLGDSVRGCSIGDVCRVRGEISSTVMLGHSNKSHAGFVGNSYLGRWVNLGAGTTTSNLKNTYGNVAMWTPTGMRDTAMQFLGSLIGDHVKLGIGSMLTTGCVIGAGANVFGAQVTPKHIPPFAWGSGEPWERNDLDKFHEVARRMMERRHIPLGDKARAQLAEAFRKSGEEDA